jgi:hypothetical protein
MRAKHASVDKESRLRGTEKGGGAIRDSYLSSLMKLFERRHETCTVSTLGPADGGVVSIFSILPEKKEADP